MERLNLETFIQRAQKIHGYHYKYDKVNYTNLRDKIIIVCPLHGEFIQSPKHHIAGSGCPKCGALKISKHHTKTTTDFVERAKKIHGNIYDYSKTEYTGIFDKVIIICKIHGEFMKRPADHLRCNSKGCHHLSGCQQCYRERQSETVRVRMLKTKAKFVEQALLIHKNKYDYSKVEYRDSRVKVEIICRIHGSFWQTPGVHLIGCGCKKCTRYISSKCISWLASLNIPDDKEHREVIIKLNNRHFYADGFDPTTNTVYEFLGDYWHGNPIRFKPRAKNKVNKKTFGRLHKEWKEKEKLLQEAGYKVISIWESDWDKNKINSFDLDSEQS